jgi:hypothetical protein
MVKRTLNDTFADMTEVACMALSAKCLYYCGKKQGTTPIEEMENLLKCKKYIQDKIDKHLVVAPETSAFEYARANASAARWNADRAIAHADECMQAYETMKQDPPSMRAIFIADVQAAKIALAAEQNQYS